MKVVKYWFSTPVIQRGRAWLSISLPVAAALATS